MTAGLHHRAPVKDKDRPNFIFSSDIPYKISSCVTQLHLYSGGFSRKCVDLTKYIEFFEITLALNALLLRNRSIVPSQLIRNNHIFVAKAKTPRIDYTVASSTAAFPEVWQSILSMQKTNETFVVNFHLELDEFSVNLADVADVKLRFRPNDTLTQFQVDTALFETLKTYIRQRLLQELKDNSDLSLHIKDSATILQDSPPKQNAGQFSAVSEGASESFKVTNISFDDSDTSCIIDKQLVFYDDDDFESSDDELRLLHSDDSVKFHSNPDDESDNSPMSPHTSKVSQDEISHMISGGLSGLSLSNDVEISNPSRGTDKESHVTHFSAKKEGVLPLLDDAPSIRASSPSVPEDLTDNHTDNLTDQTSVHHGEHHNRLNSSLDEVGHDVSEEDDRISSVLSSPRRNETRQVSGTTPSLSKKPSLSFIDHDDGHGLKSAFRDSSSSVPEYIKENKKFKFIKVGKVQKFVNMFEENYEGSSNASSRAGTRPGSPAKPMI